MSKTLAILQSNYLPWRGYFDLIRRSDAFILWDIVQYTARDWRNRNLIKTRDGPRWLTVPVRHSRDDATAIDEAVVSDSCWARKHVNALNHAYSRAACYAEEAQWLFALLEEVADEPLLSRINARLLTAIAKRLGIATPILPCTAFLPRAVLIGMERTDRIVAVCSAAGATRYVVGPAAKAYLDVSLFAAKGIEVVWMSYEGYPDYPQLHGPFEPKLSIVDLLLNTGASAGAYFPPFYEDIVS